MKPILTNVTFGADPEIFLADAQSGNFVSSLDTIGGTKTDPRPIGKSGLGVFTAQEDNVLAEFNIPPVKTEDQFVDALRHGMGFLQATIPPQLMLKIETSHCFLPAELEDPRARQFGCDPDFNAWTGRTNPRPPVPTDGLRTAGGHIHVGYTIDTEAVAEAGIKCPTPEMVNREIVKWADVLCAIPATAVDTDTRRRRLYGKAGAYRSKPYGVEYRTLSSFWLKKESYMRWVFSQMKRAVESVANNVLVDANPTHIGAMLDNPGAHKSDLARYVERYKLVIPA